MRTLPVSAGLLALAIASAAMAVQPPAEQLFQDLEDRDRLGSDRRGYLWAWKASSGRVELYSPQGERQAAVQVPQVYALDVDAEWGVAALVRGGRTLQGLSLEGRPLFLLPFDEPMGDVVWIDTHQVAVAPTLSDHRVEIWDVEVGSRVRSFGQETPIKLRPGAQFSRTVDLAYDAVHRRLFTIESRTGDLRVFTLEGEPIGRTRIENPRFEEFEQWMRQVDRDMKRKGETHVQGLPYFRLAVGDRGDVWTVRRCGEGTAELVRISPTGASESKEIAVSCCSTGSMISGNQIVLHRLPDLSGGP